MAQSDKGIQPQKRKTLKYGFIGLISVFLIYHSIDIESLDSRIDDNTDEDVAQLAEAYFSNTLPSVLENAPTPCMLIRALSGEDDHDWGTYGKQTNIGNRYYFLVRGEGVVQEIEDSFVLVAFGEGEEACSLRMATVYVFGNEIRDASGELRLQDVGELEKFNTVSELINKKVRDEIVPEFLKEVQVGQKIQLAGAFALNRRTGVTDDVEIMPIHVQTLD